MSQRGRDELFYENSNGRTESFSNYHVPNTDTVLSWPYKSPSPEFMSKLGFYYEPTVRYRDRVKCISCNKLTSTWKNCKDPVTHHLKKSPKCWFSRMHKHIRDRANEAGHEWKDIENFNEPLSTEAVEIRSKTFGHNWPYDKVEGANPTSEKMIYAGFYYYPQEKDDDLVMCIYCGVSLEGWELDDDPLFEHKKRNTSNDCYYLRMLAQQGGVPSETPGKRPNTTELYSSETKKAKLSPEIDSEQVQDTSLPRLKPRRAHKKTKPLVIDVSDSEEGDASENFGVTSNEKFLQSDEEYNQSVASRSTKSTKASKLRKSTSAIKNNSSVLTSPKKAKLLDSSFGDNDFFSNKNLKDTALELIIKSKPDKLKEKPKNSKTKKLLDITNVSTSYISHSKSQISMSIGSKLHQEQTSIKEILQSPPLVEGMNVPINANEVYEKKHIIQEPQTEKNRSMNIVAQTYGEEEEEDEKENAANEGKEDDNDSIILVSNSKNSISQNEEAEEAGAESEKSSPVLNKSKRKAKGSPLKQLQSSSATTFNATGINPVEPVEIRTKGVADEPSQSNNDSQPLNKSFLSQSRFFESPKLTRSRSPFLDDGYKGADDISVPLLLKNSEPLIDPNDIPIEESTDHNIEAHFKPISNSTLKKQKTENEQEQEPREEKQELKSEAEVKVVQGSEQHEVAGTMLPNSPSDDSFHNANEALAKNTINNTWIPTDTNKLFEPLEDLEIARNYISEIKSLPYELHDDIDGRVSYFINEIPDAELDMTIDEWIKYSAKQGKAHFEQICQQMINQFDKECDRALERLKTLST